MLSKSQGILPMMRGAAECNAHKTVGGEYPERHATCAHEVMLRRQAIQLCRNGCTLRTAPTMMSDICLCAWECGDLSAIVYFKCQSEVRPDGCA